MRRNDSRCLLLGCALAALIGFRGELVAQAASPAAGPVQVWRFDGSHIDGDKLRPAVGTLGGGIIGATKLVDIDGMGCVELAPAPAADGVPGGGGVLLTTDASEAGLPAGAMTVEAWVSVASPLDWGGIAGAFRHSGAQQQGWVLGYRRDRFFFGLATEGANRITYLNSATPLVLKEWYHLVATYDGAGQQRLYVDGRPDALSEVQRGPILQPEPLFYMLGAYRDDDDDYPFSGRLAEISVWHRALDAAEVAARFEARKAKFPGIEPAAPDRPGGDGDWVTWMGDNQRSGRAPQGFQPHPSGAPRWVYRPARPPAPAWPETARSDHWRRRSSPEVPKATFDWVHDVVVAEGRVFFGSSADDGVRCLDAETGETVWTYHAGGPVRLAPTVSAGRVLFGCDDGLVYCLDAADGKLRWRSRPASAPDRRLPGNGRLMSAWPVRTGVLVKGDTGYFGAGLFPGEGAWYCTVDLRDGRMLDEKKVGFSPQGHVFERDGHLFSQAGRAKSDGALGSLGVGSPGGRAKELPLRRTNVSVLVRKRYPYASVETPELVFVGGEGGVAAVAPHGDAPVWEAEVDAPARGMAVAGGQLFVSTTSGSIYAFGEKRGEGGAGGTGRSGAAGFEIGRAAERAGRLIGELPRRRGYALVLGVGDGSLLRSLAEGTELHVVGVDTDGGRLAELRGAFAAAGLYGARGDGGSVALQEVEGFGSLPFVGGVFNLITTGRDGVAPPAAEVERLLRPWDGVAVLGDGAPSRTGAPDGAGGWTHAYADPGNTASSGDRLVDGEVRLRWFGRPGPDRIVDRHMRASPPLAAGGYLLVPGRDYLYGLDAHNGTVLWERELAGFVRVSMLRDCGNLALDPRSRRVFAACGASCLVIDADTGATVREISVDAGEEEWGYLASVDGLLVGSAVEKGAVRREISYANIYEGGYGDGKRAVCSRRLFAHDPDTGGRRWAYQPGGAIVNPSVCIDGGRVMFLESRNAATLGGGAVEEGSRPPGRWGYGELVGVAGADLVALDLASGAVVWKRPFEGGPDPILTFYLSCRDGHLVAVHSRNSVAEPAPAPAQEGGAPAAAPAPAPARPTLHYDVRVMGAADGAPRWGHVFDTGRRPNLDHGEQDLHPVVVDGRLIAEPYVFDLATGDEMFTFKRQGGGGCGAISASSGRLYFRASTPAAFDLETKRQEWVSRATRPGCWINMIPASGLLLVPEGSSGCVCDFPVQASMGFAPAVGGGAPPGGAP